MKANRKKSLSRRFAHYQAFVEGVPVGMAVIHVPQPDDEKTWSLIAHNWLARYLVGSSLNDFLCGPIMTNLGPQCTGQIREMVRETLRTKRIKSLGQVGSRHSAMHGCYWTKIFPFDKNCVGFLFEDHSLLRKARSARSESDNYCRSMAELARAILWRADPDTLEIHYISPEGREILGYWSERWQSEIDFLKNHLHSEDRENVMRVCVEAIRTPNAPQECECRMVAADGRIVWFRLLVRTVVLHTGRTELLGVMTDISKLKNSEDATRRLSRRLIQLQDEEHRRLSRELHDGLGQGLSGLKMNLDMLRRQLPLEIRSHPLLEEALKLAEASLQEVRTVSYLLHPPVLDELGLVKALSWYLEGFQKRSGLRVSFLAPKSPVQLPENMQLPLFRIVQECLANIHRHSKSDSAEIRLEASHGILMLEVVDHGRGIPPEIRTQLQNGASSSGVGICGMRERVAEMDGTFTVESNTEGTTIRVTVPLTQSHDPVVAALESDLAKRHREAAAAAASEIAQKNKVLHFTHSAGKN